MWDYFVVLSRPTRGRWQAPNMKRDHEVRFPDKFWRRETRLSMSAKGLYATISSFADYRTGDTFVSNERLQLETGFGRDKVEHLLSELEAGSFIKRRRELRSNLRWKRWIRCLKYVSSDTLKCSASGRYSENQDTENQGIIRTSVKSSVTQEKKDESSFPHTNQIPERIM